jgi:hypothetical protein
VLQASVDQSWNNSGDQTHTKMLATWRWRAATSLLHGALLGGAGGEAGGGDGSGEGAWAAASPPEGFLAAPETDQPPLVIEGTISHQERHGGSHSNVIDGHTWRQLQSQNHAKPDV